MVGNRGEAKHGGDVAQYGCPAQIEIEIPYITHLGSKAGRYRNWVHNVILLSYVPSPTVGCNTKGKLWNVQHMFACAPAVSPLPPFATFVAAVSLLHDHVTNLKASDLRLQCLPETRPVVHVLTQYDRGLWGKEWKERRGSQQAVCPIPCAILARESSVKLLPSQPIRESLTGILLRESVPIRVARS